jgi:thiol-disulfide isomerase/thioredoxin
MNKFHLLVFVFVLSLTLSACIAPGLPSDAKPDSQTPQPGEISVLPTSNPVVESTEGSPGWQNEVLKDVNLQSDFRIADFSGKVVLLETMAIWCTTCKRQQQEVVSLHQILGDRDDLVTVVLDVDPNEDANSLAQYSVDNGFNWVYAISTSEVSRGIASSFGDQFLNPSSAPMIVIDKDGIAHPLPFGVKTASELLAQVQPFLDK